MDALCVAVGPNRQVGMCQIAGLNKGTGVIERIQGVLFFVFHFFCVLVFREFQTLQHCEINLTRQKEKYIPLTNYKLTFPGSELTKRGSSLASGRAM